MLRNSDLLNRGAMNKREIWQQIERSVTVADLDRLPALMTAEEYGHITGLSIITIYKRCKEGTIPAVKCGREWRINTARALAALGLTD